LFSDFAVKKMDRAKMNRALSIITPARGDCEDNFVRSNSPPGSSPNESQSGRRNNVSFGMIFNHYNEFSDEYAQLFYFETGII